MIEIELMLQDIRKLMEKEKGIRNRILLEQAQKALNEYEKAVRKE